jgi:hypothetical protein
MNKPIFICCVLLLPSILTAQTVAYYHFDGTNGAAADTILDSGPNGFDGSTVGTAVYAPGPAGTCLDLTGDYNFVTIPGTTNLALTNSWTVEMLFRVNVPYVADGSDPAALINKINTPDSGDFLDSFCLQLGSAGVIAAQIGFGNLNGDYFDSGSSGNYSDGNWHHVALVYSMDAASGTNTALLYADYALVNSISGTFPAIDWENYPINIGAGNYPNNYAYGEFRRNLDGQVDEVRISSVALTPDQFVSIPGGRNAPLAIQGQVGGVLLSWTSATNEACQLQARTDLSAGSWVNLGGPIIGTGSMQTMSDAYVEGRAQRFYQLLVSP